MKKILVLFLTCAILLGITGCKNGKTFEIGVTVPAGSGEEFFYSREEISPMGNKITVFPNEDLGDIKIILKPVEVKEENVYEPIPMTSGDSIEIDVEKGAWYKLGILTQNDTESDKKVYIKVDGIEVRIE